MERRRMFNLDIIDTDLFIEMPQSSRLLYYELCMRADDDGFVGSPKKIQRMVGCSEDDFKVLISKQFIIPFETGIVVIKHWKIHNYIQKDRYKETIYIDEKSQLHQEENGMYTKCIQNVNNLDTQYSIDKNSIDKIRIDKNRIDYNNIVEIYNQNCYNLSKVSKLTDKRKNAIRKFLKEFTTDDFINICNLANNNDFLTGNNDRNWKADFDFLLKPDKATAILENKYSKKKDKLDGFKNLWEEAKIQDEQTRNSTNNNIASW